MCFREKRKFSRAFVVVLTSLFIVFITGCRTPQKYAAHKDAYAQGQYIASVNAFQKDMDKRIKKAGKAANGEPNPVPGSRQYALDDMEIGTGYRAAKELSPSIDAFERAEQGIREQQEENLAANSAFQVASLFANDNALPYQVQEYDSIMVNTYKALNLLQQGEIDKARVEFKRVEERQRMAAEYFQKQIAKAKADEEAQAQKENEESDNADMPKSTKEEGGLKGKIKKLVAEKFNEAKDVVTGALRDGENKEKMDDYEQTFSPDTWDAQEAFTNPFANYMQGLFLLVYGEDQSDAEASVLAFTKAFRKEADPAINPAAKALALATEVANGNKQAADLQNKIFVIFENGLGPERQEYMLPLVIPLRLDSVANATFIDASVVLPKLVSRNEAFPYLSVCDNGIELAKTVSVCNMDAVVAAEYRERMPMILLRNVMQSGVKAVLQVIIIEQLANQGIPRIVASAAVAALFNLTKSADLRIWSSLPKNFQVAVVDRPSSGNLQFMVPGAPAPIGTAEIPEKGAAIVFVHTPSAQVPLTINVISAAK